MNAKTRRHMDGTCGIWVAHSDEDHRASDRIRGVVRGRVFDPGTKRWYKDGFAPFQLGQQDLVLVGTPEGRFVVRFAGEDL